MVQTALAFFAQPGVAPNLAAGTLPATAPIEVRTPADPVGFEIGRDHARHGLTPPLEHLQSESPVRQGWQSGRAALGTRTRPASAAVRQWLQLRLQAWSSGVEFEDVQVTPNFLARIDAPQCPVRRVPLLLQSGRDDDSVVQRLNGKAAYAAGNLAALSRSVARARGDLRWNEALEAAQQLEARGAVDGHPPTLRGLDHDQWLRLAVLSSFATPIAHERAACLPLRVLPPNRVRVINPVQALQLLLTLQFTSGGYARRMLELSTLVPGTEARQAFHIFMHTLLARRMAVGPNADALELRRALEDSWADPLVNRRWQRLALRLSAADCERVVRLAAQRGLVVGGGRWIGREAALEGWALPEARSAAEVVADGASANADIDGERQSKSPKKVSACWTASGSRPGSARKRGSQKLAS